MNDIEKVKILKECLDIHEIGIIIESLMNYKAYHENLAMLQSSTPIVDYAEGRKEEIKNLINLFLDASK